MDEDDLPKTSVPKLGQPLSFCPAFETNHSLSLPSALQLLGDWSGLFRIFVVCISTAVLFYAAQGISQQSKAPTRDVVEEARTPGRYLANVRNNKKALTISRIFLWRKRAAVIADISEPTGSREDTGIRLCSRSIDAKQPMRPAEEIQKNDIADKPKVMVAQQKLLQQRYNLAPKLDPDIKMTRGKPLSVGPTARLPNGLSWQSLAQMAPGELRQTGCVPVPVIASSEARRRRHGISRCTA